MNTLIKNVTLFSSLLFSTFVFSDASTDETNKIKFGFVLGVSFGGDTLLDLPFEDGSSQTLTAGDSIFFGASVINQLNSDTSFPLFAEVGLNYMTKSIDAENGSVSFTRFPLDAFLNTKKDQFSIGAGITYHLSPEIDGDGVLDGNVKYDNALGTAIKATYTQKLNNGKSGIAWGLRYTRITYTGKDLYDQDGSNLALTMGTGF